LILGIDSSYLDEEATIKLQKELNSIPIEKLPIKFRSDNNDNSHWCCKIDPPVLATQQTRVSTRFVVQGENYKCGYDNCGFLGMSKCTRYCKRYMNIMTYYFDTYTVYQQQPCPQQHQVCCKDFILLVGQCYHILEIYGSVELLQLCNELNICQGLNPGIGK